MNRICSTLNFGHATNNTHKATFEDCPILAKQFRIIAYHAKVCSGFAKMICVIKEMEEHFSSVKR